VTDTYEHSDRMDSYERVARIAAEIKLVPNVERRFKWTFKQPTRVGRNRTSGNV